MRTATRSFFPKRSGQKFSCLVALVFGLTVIFGAIIGRAAPLPVYIEDNHAGTFYWLAEHLDLDQPCTLLHFDAHSDASAIFDSDKIRRALRQVSSSSERRDLLAQWRNDGTVQCFNWIEPLMPSPISRVIWIREGAAEGQTARAQVDGHLEAAPRAAGSFAARYETTDLAHLEARLSKNEPVIATIDLDSFSGLDQEARAIAFNRVWNFAAGRSNLRAITFAISRPYLKDDAEADSLLLLALNAARSLPIAQIEFEPFEFVRHDHSLRGRDFAARGESIPVFDVERASEDVKSILLAEAPRLIVQWDPEHWQELLRRWQAEAPDIGLTLQDRDPSTDGVWRIPAGETGQVELLTQPWTITPDRVEWSALVPAHPSCNVSRLDQSQAGFIAEAAARPAWVEERIAGGERTISLGQLDRFFDSKSHCGSIRLRARAAFAQHLRESPVIEIRRQLGSGFRAAITEQFGLPYLFGGGELSVDGETGAEANLGTDCANFIVYALRRQGLAVRWSDPTRLRSRLSLVAGHARPGQVGIDPDRLQSGLIVHLGAHVAAVLEDRPPLGVLDGGDLVAHQLKGFPEALTLSELLASRRRETFDLFQLPAPRRDVAATFGGDVMLARSCAEKIRNGIDPFGSLQSLFSRSCFLAANLECVLTERPAGSDARYAFAAPPAAASSLQRAGFRAVALANNHALDFGETELARTAIQLRDHGIEPVGLASVDPSIFHLPNGQRLGLVALTDLPDRDRRIGEPRGRNNGLVSTSLNRDALEPLLSKARAASDLVVCMVHWGEENNPHPSQRQRDLARWLVRHGADVIVGAHPHCLQPLDFYHGKPIAYSLGNLVFDGAPSLPEWNKGALLQLYLAGKKGIGSAELVPVRLIDGLPAECGRDELVPPGRPRSAEDAGRDDLVSSAR